jgi:hypothetical protein
LKPAASFGGRLRAASSSSSASNRRIAASAAPEQIKRWLKDAGVTVERQRDLAPVASVGHEKLTVSLWLGMKPAVSREKKKRSSVEFAA